MIEAFIVYFGLLFSLLYLALKGKFSLYEQKLSDQNNYLKISIISIVLFTLIIGLRYYVGGDYVGYLDDFNDFVNHKQSYKNSRYELGYFGMMFLLKTLHLPYPFLFITISFLQILYIYKWANLNKFLLPWVLYFYFSTLYLFESMNIMRQAIAFSIILFSINYIYKSEKIKFLILVVLASLFHKSAIVFLPFYFFIKKDWFKNKYIQIVLLIISFIAAKFIFVEFFNRISILANLLNYDSYGNFTEDMFLEERTSGFGLGLYFILIIDIIIIYYSDQLKKEFKDFNFIAYNNMFFVGALFSAAASASNSLVLYRFLFYFVSFRMIVLSFLCYYLFSIKKTRISRYIGYFIVVYFLLLFVQAVLN